MIVVPSSAAAALLDQLLSATRYWYHLYTVDLDLSATTQLSDFTEATFQGYQPQPAAHWTPALDSEGCISSVADPLLWTVATSGDPQSVYGYYVTIGQTGPLVWCERRPAGPVDVSAAGQQVEVLPRFTLREDPDPC